MKDEFIRKREASTQSLRLRDFFPMFEDVKQNDEDAAIIVVFLGRGVHRLFFQDVAVEDASLHLMKFYNLADSFPIFGEIMFF